MLCATHIYNCRSYVAALSQKICDSCRRLWVCPLRDTQTVALSHSATVRILGRRITVALSHCRVGGWSKVSAVECPQTTVPLIQRFFIAGVDFGKGSGL